MLVLQIRLSCVNYQYQLSVRSTHVVLAILLFKDS